jgi:hypothetical protein
VASATKVNNEAGLCAFQRPTNSLYGLWGIHHLCQAARVCFCMCVCSELLIPLRSIPFHGECPSLAQALLTPHICTAKCTRHLCDTATVSLLCRYVHSLLANTACFVLDRKEGMLQEGFRKLRMDNQCLMCCAADLDAYSVASGWMYQWMLS